MLPNAVTRPPTESHQTVRWIVLALIFPSFRSEFERIFVIFWIVMIANGGYDNIYALFD